jgi:hypothetical protein
MLPALSLVTSGWGAESGEPSGGRRLASVLAVMPGCALAPVAIVRMARHPAPGWMALACAFSCPCEGEDGYATQKPGTAIFWNRCGAATVVAG